MNEVEIKVKGISYPCYPTAGAMLRFKRKTKKEISEIDLGDIDDTGNFLYCCARSACRREDVEFPYKDEQDFLDCLMPGDITSWAKAVAAAQDNGQDDEDDEKKSHSE